MQSTSIFFHRLLFSFNFGLKIIKFLRKIAVTLLPSNDSRHIRNQIKHTGFGIGMKEFIVPLNLMAFQK